MPALLCWDGGDRATCATGKLLVVTSASIMRAPGCNAGGVAREYHRAVTRTARPAHLSGSSRKQATRRGETGLMIPTVSRERKPHGSPTPRCPLRHTVIPNTRAPPPASFLSEPPSPLRAHQLRISTQQPTMLLHHTKQVNTAVGWINNETEVDSAA